MEILIVIKHAIIGFIMAFLGLLSPGLLTTTTLNTAVDRGDKEAVKFAFGAILPIFVQAHLALLGADYLKNHPQLIRNFSRVAVFVFLGLSILFFIQYLNRNSSSLKYSKLGIRNSFLFGFFVSLINPLAIPFYFTYSSILEFKGIIKLEEPYISIFVISAMIGAFLVLYIYAKHAVKVLSKIQLIAHHFKLILAIIMFVLSITSYLSSKYI